MKTLRKWLKTKAAFTAALWLALTAWSVALMSDPVLRLEVRTRLQILLHNHKETPKPAPVEGGSCCTIEEPLP